MMPISLRSRPIMKRRMSISGARPLPNHAIEKIKQRNFPENLDLSNRSTDDGLRRPMGDMYGWNGNNSGGQLGLSRNAPPPPQNLDWSSSGPRRNLSPVGMYDRNLSTNMMGYGNFENQRPRGRESNEFIPNSYAGSRER
ncbi:uncharacterized protein LOC121467962 [Drosophila elegans]|uniref:uncharacterized protein LOC121467962 n=1 Tax=Drosophila elegans TaxID=30023 RepID=UPI001BC82D08|nr:uncharacterized protein LOC121467962 [Drosophila elegans]